MMPVNDAEVRWSILKYLSGLIDAGQIEPLIDGGLTPELLDVLRNRRMRDLTRVADDASIGFHLKVDNVRLTRAFLRLDAIVRDQEILEYFVRNGAPSHLLIRIFQVSNQELRSMRETLCGEPTHQSGRPKLPAPVIREAIHIAWGQICAGQTETGVGRPERREREQLYALSQRFPDYTIGALWTVLNEFGDPYVPPQPRGELK